MEKNNNKLVVVLLIVIICLLAVSGFLTYKLMNNGSNVNVNDSGNSDQDLSGDVITGTVINTVEIRNDEVKELYEYVKPEYNPSVSNCLGWFYYNELNNHTLDNKVWLVLGNYSDNYAKEINDDFLNKLSKSDREFVSGRSFYYVDADIVRQGMKKIFNIDVNDFKTNENVYGLWTYLKNSDIFVDAGGGGGSPLYTQQVIEYNELSDEINLIVAKAEFGGLDNVYRDSTDERTLVLSDIIYDKFKFTEENVDKFPQLKYVFKKNSNGKYYLSNIVNLNYKNDSSEWCN